MAQDTASTQALQILLPPNEILINVVHALNGHVGDLTSKIDVNTTCIKAIDHAKSVLENHHLLKVSISLSNSGYSHQACWLICQTCEW